MTPPRRPISPSRGSPWSPNHHRRTDARDVRRAGHDPGLRRRFVHLQLRRFAGGPLGNLHLRSIVTRHNEIRVHGIREVVVVFHTTAAELAKHEAALPLPLIADPERELYPRRGGLAAAVGTRSTTAGVLGPVKPTGGRTGCPTR